MSAGNGVLNNNGENGLGNSTFTSITDSFGNAFAFLSLGGSVGANTVTASYYGLPSATGHTTERYGFGWSNESSPTATIANNASVVLEAGGADPTANEAPMVGFPVNWTILAQPARLGNTRGSLSSAAVNTDSHGRSVQNYTLGTTAGVALIMASIDGQKSIYFQVAQNSGLPCSAMVSGLDPYQVGPLYSLFISPGNNVQLSGTLLDCFGNLAPNSTISWSVQGVNQPSGSVGNFNLVSTQSDSNGVISNTFSASSVPMNTTDFGNITISNSKNPTLFSIRYSNVIPSSP